MLEKNFATRIARLTFGAAFGMVIAGTAHATDLSGAGSTFAYPLYAKWADSYKTKTNIGLNYQSIGSGGGIKQIEAKTVDFGASDMPLAMDDLAKNNLMQFPTAMGGVVLVVNIPGLAAGQLTLDGPTLGDIYLGKIAKWNDPEIVKLNPGLKLPALDIAVVHRSDGSGTTFIFTDYLSKVNPEWKSKIGSNTAVDWPTGLGGKGSEGVSAVATQTVGGIGYVEYAYALQNKLVYTKLKSHDGTVLSPTIPTFQAAGANADWKNSQAFAIILTDQPGKESWPITGATFILVQKNPDNPQNAKQVLDFFAWAYKNGNQAAQDLAYIPMPASVVPLIEQSWKDVKGPDGKPVWAGPTS
ncbi:MAG TPA: phosphate ABC transporter substrate-binding protein PstS [Stellaceae bacterium]|jgi:phosphate transport system substrate-binding protein|nr:phosphate ABC transporter substrate-binding protein PstS [Stellaceae bacterium]